MAQWQFNRPPNWPASVTEPALDWRPDPAWGPPPVGWELWQRRRPRILGPRFLAVTSGFAALFGVVAIQLASAQPTGPAPALISNVTGGPAQFTGVAPRPVLQAHGPASR